MRRALIALLLVAPGTASAGVVISEIMYDFPGVENSGAHDWVEVQNTGTAPVDISGFRLFEANTNHTLKLDRGSATLPAGGVAVIANATSTFLADVPSFSGTLFDSSFDLNSSGELLKLCSGSCSAEGSVVEDSVTYVPLESATNNGHSLQLVGGAWAAAVPTPGSAPQSSSGAAPGDESAASAEPAPSVGGGGTPLPEPRLFAVAGSDRSVTVGASALYEGRAVGELGKPIDNARFIWNFGNGDTREGRSVLYAHPYPGEYAVMLTVANGETSATDRLVVRALPAAVRVSSVTSEYVEVSNTGERDIDLSFWMLRAGNAQFILPKNTILLARGTVRFANSATGLSTLDPGAVALLYPNGAPVPEIPAPVAPIAPGKGSSIAQSAAKPTSGPSRTQVAPEDAAAREAFVETQAASVALSAPNDLPVNVWVVAFAGLVGVSALSVVLVRRRSRGGSGYTITEVRDIS